jgi:hypothetical protein
MVLESFWAFDGSNVHLVVRELRVPRTARLVEQHEPSARGLTVVSPLAHASTCPTQGHRFGAHRPRR